MYHHDRRFLHVPPNKLKVNSKQPPSQPAQQVELIGSSDMRMKQLRIISKNKNRKRMTSWQDSSWAVVRTLRQEYAGRLACWVVRGIFHAGCTVAQLGPTRSCLTLLSSFMGITPPTYNLGLCLCWLLVSKPGCCYDDSNSVYNKNFCGQ
ncbi:uncharacterized protein LOC135337857 isoform X2 [Halichondria panicea]